MNVASPPSSGEPTIQVGAGRTVVVFHTPDQLAEIEPDWQDLAQNALEPNVFFEPAMLLPALRLYGKGDQPSILALYSEPAAEGARRVLCGLFPLTVLKWYHRLPIHAWSNWHYIHCFLGTPLVREEGSQATIEAFLEWLRRSRGPKIIEFRRMADGPVFELLMQAISRRQLPSWETESYERAIFFPRRDLDEYIRSAMSGRHHKGIRRLERRLEEQGRLEYEELSPDGEVQKWIDEFLELESSGWKGQEHTALVQSETDREFFKAVVHRLFAERRLMMLALRQNGRPIAMKCNFMAKGGSFAFKIAYDESLKHFSPGVLLEMENLRLLHLQPRTSWMDSCAEAGHIMINRLWIDRRRIRSLAVSTGKLSGKLILSVLPGIRSAFRRFSRPESGGREEPHAKNDEADE